MVVNIEDAGFEIRDQIQWIYGSGFPKSHNIGKAVDKLEGNEREVVGTSPAQRLNNSNKVVSEYNSLNGKEVLETKGTSPYEGWGTALKPANEPICVARKPLSEKSVAENVLKWGTGGINVDGCRVGNDNIPSPQHNTKDFVSVRTAGDYKNTYNGEIIENEGRFPANIILECICDEVIKGETTEKKVRGKLNDHKENSVFGIGGVGVENYDYNDKGDTHTDPNCPCRLLDEQSGESSQSGKLYKGKDSNTILGQIKSSAVNVNYSDKGGASRFFYQAKVSKAERNMGLDGFEDKVIEGRDEGQDERNVAYKPRPVSQKNTHPTVKPINLMAYLCRLITPEGGVVLDPFMGSGSTGVAAQLEGFRFVGMEMDKDYFNIAEARIDSYEKYKKFKK
jgi:site-specific DNA-methyltransferase (adenine-specific)